MNTRELGTPYNNYYHCIGSCKYRYDLFRDQSISERLDQILRENLESKGMKVIANVVAYDHIHVLVQSDQGTAKTKKTLFGASARLLRQEFAELKLRAESGLWGGTEAIPIADERHFEQCVRYIQEHEPWKSDRH